MEALAAPRLRLAPLLRLGRAALAALLLAPGTLAGGGDVIAEDFEGATGLPSGWIWGGGNPNLWHSAPDGECGAVTRMAAYNSGPAVCDYSAAAPGVHILVTPQVQMTVAPPYRLAFDYILELGAGEEVRILLDDGPPLGLVAGGPTVLATTADFVADGALRGASLPIPNSIAFAGGPLQVIFEIATDGLDDSGRGWLLDDVRLGTDEPGTPFCFGDGSATPCPCGNAGGAGEGCANSTGSGGELLVAGFPSVASDSLLVAASGLPATAPALYFQGDARANGGQGFLFGDGLRCVGGALVRLGTKTSVGGSSSYPAPGDASISVAGGASAGATLHYQVWYRNVIGPCGFGYNLTHGQTVDWLP